ncbi:MAG: glycosyltransferase family 2 protein [Solobacterium sp.]|nr:glycosyltransferase family 2 protein [Solobacterium sp.]
MERELSIIVPCYNEEKALLIFYATITKVIQDEVKKSYELIFVDDGSSDATLKELMDLAEKDEHVTYLSFSRNFGKEAAMYAGLKASCGEYVVIMDADMQDPPALLPEMVKILDSGEYDSVATRRTTRKGEPLLRSFFAKLFYRIINRITDMEFIDGARDYRLMKRQMVDSILELSEYNRFSKGLFEWIGFRTYVLSYENVERVAGKTKWNFWKLFRYAIDGIINFSDMPLKIATGFGFLFTFLSFIFLLYIIIKKILVANYNVAGWTSTVSIILLIGGVQLISLGIIGQYISKIFMETKNRPLYIIAKTNRKKSKDESNS